MARRSTKLLRFENTLYRYKRDDQTWSIDSVNENNSKKSIDLFEKGTHATCKHMSQKVNPLAFRLGFTKEWCSSTFLNYKNENVISNTFYFQLFIQDYVKSSLTNLKAFLDKIEFKEIEGILYINIFYYMPERILKKDILISDNKKKRYSQKFSSILNNEDIKYIHFFEEDPTSGKDRFLKLNIKSYGNYLENIFTTIYSKDIKINFCQVKDIGNSATLLSSFISAELENSNTNFKKALRGTLKEIKNSSSIRGIRINCSGRLGKAPMAKTEWFKYGQIPLSKMNTNLDFAKSTAITKYGSIGTKVWVYYYN